MSKRLGLIYLLTTTLIFAAGLLMALSVSPHYTADAFLIPKEQTGSAQSSGLAGAARLLGLGGGGGPSSSFDKFQKYWGSRDVAERMIAKYPGLMRRLFGYDWDAANNRWYDHPHNLRQYLTVPLNALFGVYPSYSPHAEDLALYIKGTIKLQADPLGSELHLTYNDADAKFAQWFLRSVIDETDAALRAAEQKRDQDFVTFSRDRLEHETNVEYRAALTESVRQFEISNINAQAGQNFSFQYVEAPNLPVNHSAPKPLTYVVLAFAFANLVAFTLVAALMLWPATSFARLVNGAFGRVFGLFGQSRQYRSHGKST